MKDYRGFVGLNTTVEGFQMAVMQPKEISCFLRGRHFDAPFVYPWLPADAFGEPVVFSMVDEGTTGFTLEARITKNKSPKILSSLALFPFPKEYIIRDRIEYFNDMAQGYGSGSFKITSLCATNSNGTKARLVEVLVGVKERPGLFLKVSNSEGVFYDNVAIFFPDKVDGMTHKPVCFGEAFVLTEKGLEMTPKMLGDIQTTFDRLVKKSYGQEGLYSVNHQIALEQLTQASPGQRSGAGGPS